MTLVQTATKSFTNFSLLSSCGYTSAYARSTELDPKTKSTLDAVNLTLPDLRSIMSYEFFPLVSNYISYQLSERRNH